MGTTGYNTCGWQGTKYRSSRAQYIGPVGTLHWGGRAQYLGQKSILQVYITISIAVPFPAKRHRETAVFSFLARYSTSVLLSHPPHMSPHTSTWEGQEGRRGSAGNSTYIGCLPALHFGESITWYEYVISGDVIYPSPVCN